jgi:uncharacterized membrane protein YvlD (DUF360 family)
MTRTFAAMVRFLVNLCVYMLAAAIGLVVADVLLDSVSISYPTAFITAALLFGLIQALISPLLAQVTERNASALTGGVGIISALIALIITATINSGLSITGLSGWILAAVVVWLASMIAGFLLGLVVAKKVIKEVRD